MGHPFEGPTGVVRRLDPEIDRLVVGAWHNIREKVEEAEGELPAVEQELEKLEKKLKPLLKTRDRLSSRAHGLRRTISDGDELLEELNRRRRF